VAKRKFYAYKSLLIFNLSINVLLKNHYDCDTIEIATSQFRLSKRVNPRKSQQEKRFSSFIFWL